jgi:Protein of unknown function (DUF3987)
MSMADEWCETAADFYRECEKSEKSEISGQTGGVISLNSLFSQCIEIPKLSETALYGPAGQLVRKIDPHSETHPAAILLQLMVGVGNLIGRSPFMRAERDKHHTNLFVVVVGETARGRKGTAWGHVRHILADMDSSWTDTRIKGGLASGEGLIGELRDPKDGEEAESNDRRLLVYESEFGGVLRVMQRDGNTLSATIRSAWDTGNMSILANKYRDKKGQSLRATDCHISIIAHITRAELSRLLSDTDAVNGFANRILFCHSLRTKLLPDGGSFDLMDIAQELDALEQAVRLARQCGEMRRTPEACEYWRAIYPELTKEIKGRWGEVTSRAEAQVVRLSLLYCLLDGKTEIGIHHLKAAEALWNYCSESARWAFNESRFSRDAQQIFNALEFGTRTLTEINHLFDRHRNQTQIKEALIELNDYIVIEQRKTAGRPEIVVSLKKQVKPP